MHAESLKAISPKILLVEDDGMTSKITKAMLSMLGCEVDTAESGEQALSMLNTHYDVIFIDLGLPGISGLTLATTIRNNESCNNHSALIALTGRSDKKMQQECLGSGLNDFVTKPVTSKELVSLIRPHVHSTN